MEIQEQEQTYTGFMAWTKRSLIAIIIVLVLLALFVA
ncbi:aa3-type cytochrome c oxidase subunit IV [Eilatimonas milleporae]|uniref:Aa3 type cytochrome c oxidase subunit IV n=1 Tax=Eilatimonas milleporae TaxID=911205 RepID=A0A3M0CJE3_9PROT|nr:aa3-type cytochrome c oxidase subunit IV [Eilatimonas milleporae]RMB08995.1 aa3 type cytochrome c oxidase subunit IV [Eilatimonas milleporae]